MPVGWRVVFNIEGPTGRLAHNVLHVTNAGSATEVGEAFDTAFGAAADPSHLLWPIPSTFDMTTMDIYDIDDDGEATTYELADPLTGGAGGEAIWQASGIVTLRTAFRGPANRGRVFLGPLAEEANDAGVLDPTGQGLCQAAWEALIGSLQAQFTPLNVFSRVGSVLHPVTVPVVRSYTATQRRRAKFLQQ